MRTRRVDLAYPRMYFSFVSLFCFIFMFLQGMKGRWRGCPTMTARARPVGKVI